MFLLDRQRGSLIGVVAVTLAAHGWTFHTASPVRAAERARPEAKAAAAWKKLAGQVENPKMDRDRLREILLGFRRDHPGTSFALRAAELLADLPSPLDKLDPEKIPPLDRFEKQPKQLVAVLGERWTGVLT